MEIIDVLFRFIVVLFSLLLTCSFFSFHDRVNALPFSPGSLLLLESSLDSEPFS